MVWCLAMHYQMHKKLFLQAFHIVRIYCCGQQVTFNAELPFSYCLVTHHQELLYALSMLVLDYGDFCFVSFVHETITYESSMLTSNSNYLLSVLICFLRSVHDHLAADFYALAS